MFIWGGPWSGVSNGIASSTKTFSPRGRHAPAPGGRRPGGSVDPTPHGEALADLRRSTTVPHAVGERASVVWAMTVPAGGGAGPRGRIRVGGWGDRQGPHPPGRPGHELAAGRPPRAAIGRVEALRSVPRVTGEEGGGDASGAASGPEEAFSAGETAGDSCGRCLSPLAGADTSRASGCARGARRRGRDPATDELVGQV